MKSDLPFDLVEEILSRVPATSLKRLQSTCKRWNSLFKDRRFTEKHFHKAPKESMVLMLKENRVCPISVNLNVAPPSLEFQGALSLKDSHSNSEQEITDIFHCDGLLLCSTNDHRLVAWNPCLGETRWIQRKTGDKRLYYKFSLGYIQNKISSRSYKILKWPEYYDTRQRLEIYEFSSDSWRVLDDVFLDDYRYILYGGASSLKGNTYWIAANKNEHDQFILSFDFTAERFKHLSLPPFQNHCCVTLSVGREEQLSALNRIYYPSKIEMWVTTKIDIDQSELLWSKSFIVDIPILGKWRPVFMHLLIDAEKKVSLCLSMGIFNLAYTIGEDDEYYKQINSQEWPSTQNCRPVIFYYVPSLVQIKKG